MKTSNSKHKNPGHKCILIHKIAQFIDENMG